MDNNFLFISFVSVSLVFFIVLRFQQIKIYDCDDRSWVRVFCGKCYYISLISRRWGSGRDYWTLRWYLWLAIVSQVATYKSRVMSRLLRGIDGITVEISKSQTHEKTASRLNLHHFNSFAMRLHNRTLFSWTKRYIFLDEETNAHQNQFSDRQKIDIWIACRETIFVTSYNSTSRMRWVNSNHRNENTKCLIYQMSRNETREK